MRALFWGMNGVYTWTVLEMLLGAGVSVAAVLVHDSAAIKKQKKLAYEPLTPPASGRDELNLLSASDVYLTKNTVNTAWFHGLPVYAVNDLAARETAALVESFDADVACVACFPKRLPTALLNLPRHGFLNVHPSHLPDYRGPAPLFWQLRDGVDPVGVTVHCMDARWDAGEIVAQTSVGLPDGIDGPGADRLLGETGGQHLADVLAAMPGNQVVRRPQPAGGSYQPQPRADDFKLECSWSARHAYNFMRGTAEWGMHYSLVLESGETFRIGTALSYSIEDRLTTPYRLTGDRVLIRFSPGVVAAVLAQADD